MAVLAGIYGQKTPEYVGCVIDTYEHNGYEDSDWYAVCWDEEEGKVVEVEYDTTRAGGGGWAEIDATEEVLRKVYRFYHRACREAFDSFFNKKQAKEVKVGDTVKVVRGTKIQKGSVGEVFWRGVRENWYSHKEEDRVGVNIEGERVFLPTEYVEVVGWEGRLIHGAERKRRIRNEALRKMPYWVRQTVLRGEA